MLFSDLLVEQEVADITEEFSHYVEALPTELKGLTAATSLWQERGAGLSHPIPFWLNQEFADGDLLSEARQMVVANRFGEIFCFLQDGVIDRHPGTKPEILILLNAFFFRFLHGYQKLFPASHCFWTYFEEYWQEYLQAMAWEKKYHHRRIAPYNDDDLYWMGRKLSPIKICCAGMALLAKREEQIPHLSQMIEHLQTGYQLLDDLNDWSEDMANGDCTYPITLAHLRSAQKIDDKLLSIQEVEKVLWTEGLAIEVFRKAMDFLSLSLQDISHLSLPELKAWIRKIHETAEWEIEKVARPLEQSRGMPQLQVFSQSGQNIVLNVSNSTLYAIDEKAASFLRMMDQASREGIDPENLENSELLEELKIAGVFSSLDPPRTAANPPFTTLYLNVSSACNLRCVYCFARSEEYGQEGKLMRPEVGEGAVDLLLQESEDSPSVKIVFFGGEPLLNPDLVAHLIRYGRQQSMRQGKEMRFLVVTNGILLNPEMVKLFHREKVEVQISLDGPPQVQDSLRPTLQGEGTYHQILQNIQLLKEGKLQRLTLHAVLPSITPSPVEILDHLWSLGVGPISMDYASPTRDHKSAWSDKEIAAIKRFEDELSTYFLCHLHEGKLVPYLNLLKPLRRLYRRERFSYHCGAGLTMGAVTPDGAIFPCPRFVEEPDLAGGDVFAGLDREKLRLHTQYTVDRKEPCRTCWARYLCGGGCSYVNLLLNGDTTYAKTYKCDLIKHQWQTAIQLFSHVREEIPSFDPHLWEHVNGFCKL
jgi:uncharacterized protein